MVSFMVTQHIWDRSLVQIPVRRGLVMDKGVFPAFASCELETPLGTNGVR